MSDYTMMPGRPFGWVAPEARSPLTQARHQALVAAMPPFRIRGPWRSDRRKVCLWEVADAHPAVRRKLRVPIRQLTGSCVGASGGNVLRATMAVEVLRLGEPERVVLPFYLLPYGRSRLYSGLRGRGEGSLVSGFAKAIRADGVLPADADGLPAPGTDGGIHWTARLERDWSDGAAIAEKWLSAARRHPIRTVAPCRSADDVAEALQNYYAVHQASSWGGLMEPPVKSGRHPVLLNQRSGSWPHAMCWLAWWDHPELGEIFWTQNSWGYAHGECPSGAPPGGFWLRKRDVDWVCRHGEAYAYSQFDGFPAQRLDWYV